MDTQPAALGSHPKYTSPQTGCETLMQGRVDARVGDKRPNIVGFITRKKKKKKTQSLHDGWHRLCDHPNPPTSFQRGRCGKKKMKAREGNMFCFGWETKRQTRHSNKRKTNSSDFLSPPSERMNKEVESLSYIVGCTQRNADLASVLTSAVFSCVSQTFSFICSR